MTFGFTRAPTWFFKEERRGAAVSALQEYFNSYTGSWFERFVDRDRPNEITERDILAVSTLSVDVPAGTSIWLRDEGKDRVSQLLTKVPADQAIWDPDADLTRDGPMSQLWGLLRVEKWPSGGKTGMGTTKISKLLATKRPNLIPIYDSLLEKGLFGGKKPADYWVPWRDLYTSREGDLIRKVAAEIQIEAGIDVSVPVLRIIDIVIWHWVRCHRFDSYD